MECIEGNGSESLIKDTLSTQISQREICNGEHTNLTYFVLCVNSNRAVKKPRFKITAIEHKSDHAKISCVSKMYLKKNQSQTL